jgi:hypothetical protein
MVQLMASSTLYLHQFALPCIVPTNVSCVSVWAAIAGDGSVSGDAAHAYRVGTAAWGPGQATPPVLQVSAAGASGPGRIQVGVGSLGVCLV